MISSERFLAVLLLLWDVPAPRSNGLFFANAAEEKIWLPGASGSGPFEVANAWATAFTAIYPEAEVTLTSVGSGTAQSALWGDIDCQDKPVEAICSQTRPEVQKTVWGIGDAPINAQIYEDQPFLLIQQFPACAGAVAVVHSNEVTNFEKDVAPLHMTLEILSGIFNTTIQYWDDPSIRAINSGVDLPHERISKVVRADSSGQTSIITDALDYHVPSWPDEAVGKVPDWPLGELVHPRTLSNLATSCDATENANVSNAIPHSFASDGKSGVALGMLRVPYSIGYMEVGFASSLTDFLTQVKFGNPGNSDSFVVASDQTLRTTMDGLVDELNPETLELNLARTDTPEGGFPISGFAYWYLKRHHTEFSSCYQAWLLCKFVEWAYTDPQAASIASINGWVVPPESVVEIAMQRLQEVQCNNTETNPPTIISALEYTPPKYRTVAQKLKSWHFVVIVFGACMMIGVVLILYFVERRRKAGDSVWIIKAEDIKFENPPTIIGQGKFGMVLLAEYRGTQVAVKRVIPPRTSRSKDKKSSSKDKFGSIDSFFNTSTNTALEGSSSHPPEERAPEDLESNNKPISRYDSMIGRGSNHNSGSYEKTTSAKTYQSLKTMFIEEMRVMSKLRHPCVTTIMGAVIKSFDTPMLVLEYMEHGSLYDILHNETMVLDGEIILPILRDISQGLRFLHSAVPQVIHGDLKTHNILVDSKFRAKVADFGLSQRTRGGQTGTIPWMAPELLNGTKGGENSSASDVYSFGIILYEVYARKDPYDGEELRDVIGQVIDPNINKRPPVPLGMPPQVQTLMQDCVVADPEKRPAAEELDNRLKRINADSFDTEAAPKALKARKANVSLFDIFPRHIAEALRDGRKVEPEHKKCVTIFFSDIVGFTQLSSQLDPRKVAGLLDRLYSKFDDLAGKHEIYKVETIGDAYMAVTNLVRDQSEDHAKRIASFAIDALQSANETIIDPDDESLGFVQIRVGFHCGPVVADVVGNRNPRYCLFGDTVNTASRMESNSAANRILCSKVARDVLTEQMPDLPIAPRRAIKVKGKGYMETFWVNEEAKREPDLVVPLSKDGSLQIDMTGVVSGGKANQRKGALQKFRKTISQSTRRVRKKRTGGEASVGELSSQGDYSSYYGSSDDSDGF